MKQKVSAEQAELIQKVLYRYNHDRAKAMISFIPSRGLTSETFARCMLDGFEVVRTKQEQIKELYNRYDKQGIAKYIIKQMCMICEIDVEGITDDEK